MLLFIELITLAFFLACVAHAFATRGREGLALVGALLALGFVRENFVALYKILYAFAPLTLMLGAAPLIGTVIWSYSIYICVIWVEGVTGRALDRDGPLGARFWILAALFMMALAAFYEPFLALIGMARWEDGTRVTLGVPWIALVGYPGLTLLFFTAWRAVLARRLRGSRRALGLAALLAPIAFGHAFGLQALKNLLGW